MKIDRFIDMRIGSRMVAMACVGARVVWEAVCSCFSRGMWRNAQRWHNGEGWSN